MSSAHNDKMYNKLTNENVHNKMLQGDIENEE